MNEKISIIIPFFNAAQTIKEALHSLENQSFKNFDVIAVDDGSTDSGSAIVEEYSKKGNLRIRLLKQKHSGPAVARNSGAKKSNTGIIVFLDSDCIAEKEWLEKLIKSFKDLSTVGVTCGYRTKNADSLIARYVGYEIAQRQEKLPRKNIDAIGSYSIAYRKKEFLEAGMFDESFPTASGEDFDLSYKLKSKGHKLIFLPNTFVWHYHPNSLHKYLKQQFLRGYWRVPLYLKNKGKAIAGDTYTGKEMQLQFLFVNLLFLSAAFSVYFLNALPFAVVFLGLVFSNLLLGVYCFAKEKKFLLIAPLIASLRSIAGAMGAYKYFLDKILMKI